MFSKDGFNSKAMTRDGYYFMTGFSEAGITYQFNTTNTIQYLNLSDYQDMYSFLSCNFSYGLPCSFVTDMLGTNTEYCLLAHILQPHTEDSPWNSTHIKVDEKKRYVVLLIPGTIAVVSVVLATFSGALMLVKRSTKRGYSTIQ